MIELDEDRCAVLVHQRERIRGSRAPVKQAVGYIGEIRDERVTRVHVYFSWEDTLEAAGLDR